MIELEAWQVFALFGAAIAAYAVGWYIVDVISKAIRRMKGEE